MPILNSFGEVKIKLLGCDELQATFTHNGQIDVLNLSRNNNTKYNKYCLQATDLTETPTWQH